MFLVVIIIFFVMAIVMGAIVLEETGDRIPVFVALSGFAVGLIVIGVMAFIHPEIKTETNVYQVREYTFEDNTVHVVYIDENKQVKSYDAQTVCIDNTLHNPQIKIETNTLESENLKFWFPWAGMLYTGDNIILYLPE